MGRQIITISINPEQKELLDKLVETTSLNPSEIVQMMIEKVSRDEVEQEIIMQDYIKKYGDKCGKKRLLRIMSIRSTRKKLAAQRASLAGRRSCPTDYNDTRDAIEDKWWAEFCEECLNTGKTPSIENYLTWKRANASKISLQVLQELGAC